jgi:tetratricopeptide (TPR) repeat protein
MRKPWRRILAALPALAFASALHAAPSPDAQNIPTSAVPYASLVEDLLKAGDVASAQSVAEQVLVLRPHDEEAAFLLGMTQVAKGDYRRAIRQFRAILINHPDSARVRLELARAYFMDKDYANASRQFQLARAGKLPPAVVANIDRFLFLIRQEKTWSYNANLSVAPDTNLNAGPSSREVVLYGLPFQVADEGLAHSGVGMAVDAGGEWAPVIGPNRRMRLGVHGEWRDYSGGQFDQLTVGAYAGPRQVRARWDASLLATSYTRWYGGDLYTQSTGGRLEATYYLSPELGVAGSLAGQWVDYHTSPAMSGALVSAGLGATRALTPSSAVAIRGAVSRQDARIPGYANWSGFIAAGYSRDLPAGFSVYVEPSISLAEYDQALPVFGVARRDHGLSTLVTVLNRHIMISNFTPRIAYTFDRNVSNISIYSHNRNSVEIGLTTSF